MWQCCNYYIEPFSILNECWGGGGADECGRKMCPKVYLQCLLRRGSSKQHSISVTFDYPEE